MEGKNKKERNKGIISAITLEKTELIVEQLKTSICKIFTKEDRGTGFFCKILYNNKNIPVLITNYHVINDEFLKENKHIKISLNDDKIIEYININENSKIYSSDVEKYDIIIIKLEEKDNYVFKFLELDKHLFDENSEELYKDEIIYILHYPLGQKASVSYGYGFEKGEEYDMNHLCDTIHSSSGAPIFNLSTNKVIGIHKGLLRKNGTEIKIASLLKYPLNKINNSENIIEDNINNIELNEIQNKVQINDKIINIDNIKKQIILNQMKKCICKIINDKIGTGFFCKIKFQNNLIPVLITSYSIINDKFLENNDYIKLSIDNDKIQKIIKVDNNRKIYSSDNLHYSLMILRLREEDEINDYLELAQDLFDDNSEIKYKKEYFYILYYKKGEKITISYGMDIEKLNECDIKYFCDTYFGSGGAPILDFSTNRVIGIHKAKIKNRSSEYPIGTFLKYPLNEIN